MHLRAFVCLAAAAIGSIAARNLAWSLLVDLEGRADADGWVTFGTDKAKFHHVRLIGVQAYIAATWSLVDRITAVACRSLTNTSVIPLGTSSSSGAVGGNCNVRSQVCYGTTAAGPAVRRSVMAAGLTSSVRSFDASCQREALPVGRVSDTCHRWQCRRRRSTSWRTARLLRQLTRPYGANPSVPNSRASQYGAESLFMQPQAGAAQR
jgi:hypothetical protein